MPKKKKEILKKLLLIRLYLVLFHKTIAINLIESEPFFKVYRNMNSGILILPLIQKIQSLHYLHFFQPVHAKRQIVS